MTQEVQIRDQGRGKALAALLLGLIRASSDFEGAVLVGRDGLVIATAWSSEEEVDALPTLDDSEIGAVACRAFEQSEQATAMLGRGDLGRIILAGSDGNLVITRAGDAALCVVLLRAEAKLGVASFAAARIGKKLGDLLS
jgi:predicted regulator of Ras-like GTPase activity (Roadblock/LC7/MglB family)